MGRLLVGGSTQEARGASFRNGRWTEMHPGKHAATLPHESNMLRCQEPAARLDKGSSRGMPVRSNQATKAGADTTAEAADSVDSASSVRESAL